MPSRLHGAVTRAAVCNPTRNAALREPTSAQLSVGRHRCPVALEGTASEIEYSVRRDEPPEPQVAHAHDPVAMFELPLPLDQRR